MRELEIERKFLIDAVKLQESEEFKNAPKVWWIMQGYLGSDEKKAIRVRCEQLLKNEKALGVKAFYWNNIDNPEPMEKAGLAKLYIKTSSGVEYNYDMPYQEFKELYELCGTDTLEKYRYYVEFGGKIWHVDFFKEKLSPLVVAELEVTSWEEVYEKPDWVITEVTEINKFKNSHLVKHNYKSLWENESIEISQKKS